MSDTLRDCRKPLIRFAGYRGGQQNFGMTLLPKGDEPALDAAVTTFVEKAAWSGALRDQIDRPENKGRLLVFIHGYNNSYEEALERAAILRDLYDVDVPTLIIHWPSRGRLEGYINDTASLAASQRYIDVSMGELVDMADDITLVTHSLGGRAGIAAIQKLNFVKPDKAGHVRRFIMAAPDVDRYRVLRDGGEIEDLVRDSRQVTIYASQRDEAIRASAFLHGYSRLGSSNCSYDVDYARRGVGKFGNCHRSPPRDGLALVETSEVKSDGRPYHSDVFDSCIGRKDLKAALAGDDAQAWRRDVSEDGLSGFVLSVADYEAEYGPCTDD
ncbi:MAG: alpha/beta hydrolase [Pseudomonadota bacterium]